MKIKSLIFLLVLTTLSFAQLKTQSNKNEIINFNQTFLKNENSGEKSKTLAFVLSLILPGLGEYYANRFDVGKYFTIAEGTLWLTLYGFDYYGNLQKENYINFAKINGGVNVSGKNEQYWAVIGSYMNIYDYNNEKLFNRQFNLTFDENTHYWFWKSNEERKKYRNLWLSSESAFNNKQFPISLIIINHIASAINAALVTKRMNENLESSIKLYPQFGFDEFNNPQIKISFLKNF
ncbi:MAG: hypothetical protein N3F03_02040 [Ignavibacteria bacterium]|nr:hypothetical protein [Ignavibacteria bacterium]